MQPVLSGIVAVICMIAGVHAFQLKKRGWAALLLILAILNGVFAFVGASS